MHYSVSLEFARSSLLLLGALSLTALPPAQSPLIFGLEQRCQLGPTASIALDTPTASIATGVNFIVEVANSQIATYDKNGPRVWHNNLSGVAVPGCGQPQTSFFGTPSLGGTRIVDTKVLYDSNNDRYVVIGMQQDSGATPTGQPGLYVAYSNNALPFPNLCGGGGWKRWQTPVPSPLPGTTYQPDFNGMGQTDTHVIYTGNLEPIAGNGPNFTFVRVFRKADLINTPAGQPLPFSDMPYEQLPTSEFPHAADAFDSGARMTLVSTSGQNTLRLTTINTGNMTPIDFFLTVPFFFPPSGSAPQPGGGSLDTIDSRMQSAVLRDGYLYCCHTARSSGLAGARHVIRWYQIALNTWPALGGTPQLIQSGTIDLGGGTHVFMPAIAVDDSSTVVVSHSQSSATQNPSLAFAARFTFDPIGTMPQQGILFQGNSPYTSSGGNGAGADRWGDWTSVVVDPLLPSRFWVCGPFAQSGGIQPCLPTLANRWRTIVTGLALNAAGMAEPYGAGFASTSGTVPTIELIDPARLASSPAVQVSNPWGAPTLGVGLIGFEIPAPGLPTNIGGSFLVDPTSATVVWWLASAANGQFNLQIPLDPMFIGFPVALQGGVLEPGGAGIAITAGLLVTVGA